MKRYVLCVMRGTGTEADPFMPVLQSYDVNWGIAIAPDFQTNPNKQWVLAIVAGTQAAIESLSTDPNITTTPIGPEHHDQAWKSLGSNNLRQNLSNAIKTRTGITIPRDDTRTLREILNQIGQAIDPNFITGNLDIIDGTA